ncbi:290_t:CDS:1, partial [Racocetra fulgida]
TYAWDDLTNGECITPRDVPSSSPLGCFILNNGSSDNLNGLSNLGFPPVYKDRYGFIMDPGLCIIRCTDYLFEVAALKNGSQCQCGSKSNLVTSYTKVNDSICNVTCIGNSSYFCGGKESYTVYDTKTGILGHPLPTISVTDKLAIIKNLNNDNRYQQCIKDSPYCYQRVLNDTSKELSGMTVDKCIDFCSQNNFEYAGLEIGTQCFCANNYNHINQISPDECSTSCAGNNQQICGGPLAISVYNASKPNETSTSKSNEPNNLLKIILSSVIVSFIIIALIAISIIWYK